MAGSPFNSSPFLMWNHPLFQTNCFAVCVTNTIFKHDFKLLWRLFGGALAFGWRWNLLPLCAHSWPQSELGFFFLWPELFRFPSPSLVYNDDRGKAFLCVSRTTLGCAESRQGGPDSRLMAPPKYSGLLYDCGAPTNLLNKKICVHPSKQGKLPLILCRLNIDFWVSKFCRQWDVRMFSWNIFGLGQETFVAQWTTFLH